MDSNVLSRFSGLTVNENVICMDLLNYSRNFFDIPDRYGTRTVDFEADTEKVSKKVQDFIQASSKSGYKIICFIDKSISTKETYEKWMSRRTQELEEGKRNVVVNMSFILGSIFQSNGITVHFTTVDCDDTIAAFAYNLGGSVLSRDCDFFRYYSSSSSRSPPYDVFFDYDIVGGRISFNRHGGPSRYKPRASPRQIMSSLPETKESVFFLDHIPRFLAVPRGQTVSKMNQRGCGSNLTHETNPHLQVENMIFDFFNENLF